MSLCLPLEFEDLGTLLTRAETAARFKSLGLPVATTTLGTYASRGSGPPFQKFGFRPMYRWGDAVEWAEARFSPTGASCSEIAAKRASQELTPKAPVPGGNARQGHGHAPKAAPPELEHA